MGRAEEIFERMKRGGEAALDEIVAARETDKAWVDFQRPMEDGRSSSFHETDRTFLSRAISGFANSEGGIIVWGVDAGADDVKKPIHNISRFVRWLDNNASGLSIPAHPKIQNHAVHTGSGEGFAVTLIPRSNLIPHRAASDELYYMRRDSSFVSVPHRVLSWMFNQQHRTSMAPEHTELSTNVRFKIFKKPWYWGKDLPTATKVSATSTLIALCALWFTAEQASQARHHARLSVKPFIFVAFYWSGGEAGWRTGNQGLGPAQIRWFKVLVDGQLQRDWHAVIEKIGIPAPYKILSQAVYFPGLLVPVGGPGRLFWLGSPAAEILYRERSRITIQVCFCSLYEECWQSSSRQVKSADEQLVRESTCSDKPPFTFTVRGKTP
jgi:hypothetical protein